LWRFGDDNSVERKTDKGGQECGFEFGGGKFVHEG
jgi:hypothetical protein